MNVLLISKNLGCSSYLSLGRRALIAFLLMVLVVLPVAGGYAGFRYGLHTSEVNPDQLVVQWTADMEAQRLALEEAKRVSQDNLNALAQRLGQLQAHVLRLDALGQRLTRMANLDDGEFDFDSPPAQGGPSSGGSSQPVAINDFLSELDDLALQLDSRGQQLNVLEMMLINRALEAEVSPAGRPIKRGWLSSKFGYRNDPFSGRRAVHNGVDFAGKEGSEVIAVGSGVVTWAGTRGGYGVLVEINHGNGYVTRYGHNKEILVRVGEPVKKGQAVGLMGSTGRSTGPHVHFEVLVEGRHVDPEKFIQAAR